MRESAINVTGVITSTSFSGDGSGLTGVASTDNIITSTASTFTGSIKATGNVNISGIATVGILTSYESITIKVGAGSTEVATELSSLSTSVDSKASTGKAIAMAMVFG